MNIHEIKKILNTKIVCGSTAQTFAEMVSEERA